jgi:predicted DNA-binding transcriptional regulator YafY
LPAARRRDEERIRQRIYLDSTWWFQAEEPLPHLQTLYRALWDDRVVEVTLRLKFGSLLETQTDRLIAPYGLVAKAGVWHVVALKDDQLRVYRVADVIDARLTDQHFERYADFDLVDFWQTWCDNFEQSRPRYEVRLRLAPHFVPDAHHYLGEEVQAAIAQADRSDEQGRVIITVVFESLEEARSRCLSVGRAVEVLEPEALRKSMRDYAGQIRQLYAE